MGQLVVNEFLTVDGVMQAPGQPEEDRDGDFAHGGWLVPYADKEFLDSMTEFHQRGDAILLGRRTYEVWAGHWPRIGDEDPIAAAINRVPKHVASRTLTSLDWDSASLLEGETVDAVAALKSRYAGEVQVIGSGHLVQTLLHADLVDVFRLFVFPVVLGSGKRLFAGGTIPAGLELVEATAYGSGVVQHTYARDGELAYGSFALD